MKTNKLIKKTKELLSAKRSKQRKKIDTLKELLAKLKHRKRKLQASLENEKSKDKREHIRNDLEVIRAQRRKGLKALKALK
jgi:hypothetical protein